MRVLLLLDSYQDTDIGEIVFRFCQRWAPMRELTMSTVALGRDGPLADRLRNMGVSAQALGAHHRPDRRAIRDAGRRILQRAERPDLVNAHCVWPALDARVFHSANPALPFAVTVHGALDHRHQPWLQRMMLDIAERRTRRQVAAYIFNSETERKLVAPNGMNGVPVRVIAPGADAIQCFPLSATNKMRYRALLGVTDDCPLMVSAGGLFPYSGHMDLVEAMPGVLAELPETRLFIIGEGPVRDAIDARIHALGVAGNVRIIGRLGSVTPKVISTADVYIQPSHRGGFTLLVAEAQASGTPVIGTRAGAIPEIVLDGETGLLVEPGQPKELTRAMVALLRDEERRQTLADTSRMQMMERFELGRAAEEYIALWRELAPDALWRATDSIPLPEDALGEVPSTPPPPTRRVAPGQ